VDNNGVNIYNTWCLVPFLNFFDNDYSNNNAKYIIERYTQLIDKKVQEDMLQCLANPELRNIKKLRYRKLERIK
ncbi:MAG: hypothetical protein IJ675_06180, partial [Pseudobutyrivibrio sp.]|nr:hypothetical protein [Pseudobutyrivibrio sp.]